MNRKNHSLPLRVFAATILLTLLPALAHAADVTWGTPQQITGNSDVSTNGNLIGAFNVGNVGVSSTMVNGVNFQSFAAPGGNGTSGSFTTSNGFGFATNTGSGSVNPPFSSLDLAYRVLLSSSVAFTSDLNMVISGLMVGAQYEFQFFVNNSTDNSNFGSFATGGANKSNIVSDNPSGRDGGLGQYLIGTFTADAITQNIGFGPDEVGLLNAFQLRFIPSGPVGVPDRGQTLALLSLAFGGLLLFRRMVGEPA